MNILKIYKSYTEKINQADGFPEEQDKFRNEIKEIVEKEIKNVCM